MIGAMIDEPTATDARAGDDQEPRGRPGYDPEATLRALEGLGAAVSQLNNRVHIIEVVTTATADANVQAANDARERIEALEREMGRLEAALVAFGQALGLKLVYTTKQADGDDAGDRKGRLQ
jgi:hypothetical protein